MQRKILCGKCGPESLALHPEDKKLGFDARTVRLVAQRPVGHGITVYSEEKPNGVKEETPMMCDLCGIQIPDGEIVYARTVWNTKREGAPGNWEKDFGTVIPDEAAKVAEELSKPSE